MTWFLESARLRFRRYERSDLDFLASLYNDPEVMRFIGNGAPAGREAAAERLERWLESDADRGFFVACTKAESTPIGHAGLLVQDVEGRLETEVGWWLARAAWGYGYASEAGAALRDYAFNVARLSRIVHLIAPANERSIAVARRIGSHFERAAIFRARPVHVYAQPVVRGMPLSGADNSPRQ